MFLNDNDMVECPYNSTHRMFRKRLQPHLIKCRKQYADVELRKCPFNIMHLIPEPEFTHHATNCPDRKLITQYKYDAPERKEEEIPQHAPIECDENWDDTDVNDFNPRLNLKNANVILKPDGTCRSERKLFIKNERKRLGFEESSDEDNKSEVTSAYKRQRDDHSQEARFRYVRRRSLSFSPPPYSRQRSRSPNRNRSRSPTSVHRLHWEYSPHRYSHPSFSYHSPSSSAYSHYHQYYDNGGRIANNYQYNSGREFYYSNEYHQAYYHHNSEMPQAPPPPMISYPTQRSYMSKYPYPSDPRR